MIKLMPKPRFRIQAHSKGYVVEYLAKQRRTFLGFLINNEIWMPYITESRTSNTPRYYETKAGAKSGARAVFLDH